MSMAPLVVVRTPGSTSLDLGVVLLASDTGVSSGCTGSTPS
jgi:hypothetical protein